jgi:hypothetical protein
MHRDVRTAVAIPNVRTNPFPNQLMVASRLSFRFTRMHEH